MGEGMKKLFIAMVILGVLGYVGYHYAISFASDKVIDQVAEHVLNEQEVEQLLNDPDVKKMVEQDIGKPSVESSVEGLPFHTKEEALKAVTEKFSVGELNEIRYKVTDGIDSKEKEELIALLEEKLSPEEMEALKIIALKELQKKK
jgi:hypothetical protein